MEAKRFEKEVGGKPLIIETGRFAAQADGAVTVQYGDTVVLATIVKGKGVREGIDYFPLMVDYEEKFYASGKIKGSRFVKREGRPTDEAVLAARLIDRPLRPLFDQQTREDVQVVVTVLSYDGENDPDILGIIGASAATMISGIPFTGPVGAVRVGLIEDEWVLNPTETAREKSQLDLIVAARKDGVVMVEAGALIVSEEKILEALEFAQKHIRSIVELEEELAAAFAITADTAEKADDSELKQKITSEFEKKIAEALSITDKKERYNAKDRVWDEIKEMLGDASDKEFVAMEVFEELISKAMRVQIMEKGTRIDGRKLDEIRDLDVQVGVLPRTHGTGMFKRGETQVLTVTTLGAPGDEQIIDSMEEDSKKRYMHHYNFPPYSVGEVKPLRGPSRRDIGHGALAERSLMPVLPDKDEFPYTMRLVSEVFESNGSSSMASACGSSLSLMDAGVPLKAPVAGIAMGLILDEAGKYKVLTDIQGEEDHLGDMDFKVTGTPEGVTAMQMDIKVDGLTIEIMKDALAQAKKARLEILEAMNAVIPKSREELSDYAPKITTLKIDPEKIRDVIGSGGKTINEIIEKTGVEIDIEDDGSVFITGVESDKVDEAIKIIENIVRVPESGEIITGKVTRIMDFGAIVDLWPGRDGMVHVSELAPFRVENVTDILKEGDMVEVMVKEVSDDGKVSLSKKDADAKAGRKVEMPKNTGSRPPRGGRPGGHRRNDRY